MKIQWSILVLVVLGILAALCAGLLLAFMKATPVSEAAHWASAPINVLVATEDLPPLMLLREEHFETRQVTRSDAPGNSVSNPVQLVGRVLATPVTEGQVFTKGVFARGGSGKQIASKLPERMRAITIQLDRGSAMSTLLYPGSTVDVLTSFKLPSNSNLGTAVSTTLVENVEVLAVGSLTVGTETQKKKKGAKTGAPAGSRSIMVTLLVDPQQAKALQLARQFGNVSLVMRNPAGSLPDESDAMLLSQGRLAQLADVMAARVKPQDEEPAVEEPEVLAPKPAEPKPIKIVVFKGSEKKTVRFTRS